LLTFDNFYNQYKGKKDVGNTAGNIGECVGLVSLWMDNFDVPHVYGHAKDLYANAPAEHFKKIPNTPDAIPIKGDIIIWSAGFNGNYGHTGICTGKADINRLEVFEQNNPLGSDCHLREYNYAYIIGWLRPKMAVVDNYADDLTKMLGADYIRDNQGEIFSPKLDIKDNRWGKIVVDKLKTTYKDLEDSRRSTASQKEKLEGEIRSLEEEVQRVRQERDEAVSKICSDPNAHTSGNSGDSDVPTPDDDSDNNSGSTADPSQETKTTFFSLVINLWRKLFGQRL